MNRYEEIIRATLELAAQSGLGNVSLTQIADKVGIKKPSLYNHFSSKEDLINQMYEYLRKRSAEVVGQLNYQKMVQGKKAEEILLESVMNYHRINQTSEMFTFYKVIYSERAFHKEAAEIVVKETKRMILATKNLFYAIQAYGILKFDDIDQAAESFSMTVHAMLDYDIDLKTISKQQKNSGSEAIEMVRRYIFWFCKHFQPKNVCHN